MTPDAFLEMPDGTTLPVRGTCTIGRAPDCHLSIPDRSISRRHALIHAQGADEFWLVDLGSRNGTYENDRRVVQPTQLRHQDRVRIGDHPFTFVHPVQVQSTSDTLTDPFRTVVNLRMMPCWFVVADVVASTNLALEAGPQEAGRLLGQWLADCRDAVDRHGGEINKFLGDGFFAFWLAKPGSEDPLVEGLRALRAFQGRAPSFRLALHQGEAVIGATASLGEEDLSGPDVNFAFRLEKVAAGLRLSTLASGRAQKRLAGRLDFTPAGRHPVPGFPEDHELFSW